MFRTIAIFAALMVVTIDAGSATCVSTNSSCSGNCTVTPKTFSKGGVVNINVLGDCPSKTVTSPTYDLKLVFGGIPVLSKTGEDGCKDATFNLPLNMGALTIKGVECPIPAGKMIEIKATSTVGKLAPNGKLTSTVAVHDGSTELFGVEIDVTLP